MPSDFDRLAGEKIRKHLEDKKKLMAKKMKPFKPSQKKEGEGDREHYHRLEREFYSYGK